MASLWKTVIIPTPAQPGVHYANPTWDTANGYTAFVIAHAQPYDPNGTNSQIIQETIYDQFGFAQAQATIDTVAAAVNTLRYSNIAPVPNKSIVFYEEKIPNSSNFALERDITTINGSNITQQTAAVATLPGAADHIYTSYRSSGTGAGTYSVAWDSGSGQSKTANILIFDANNAILTPNGAPVTRPIVDDGSPVFAFRSGLGAYTYVSEQVVSDINSPNFGRHFLHIEGILPNGSQNTSFAPFNVSSNSTNITDAKFVQFPTGANQQFYVYNEKNLSNGTPVNNVVVKVVTPGSGVTKTVSIQTASGNAAQDPSADQKVRVTIDGALNAVIVAYGDATGTHLKEYDPTGVQIGSFDLPGVPFLQNDEDRGQGLQSLDDGRVLVASQPDRTAVTTSVTLNYVDFRTAAININNAAVSTGVLHQYAGTNFATGDVVIGSLADPNTFMGMAGNDSFTGGNNIDTAIFRGNRAEYLVHGNASGGVVVQDIGAAGDGTDTLTKVDRLQFADVTVPAVQRAFDYNGDGKMDVMFTQNGAVFASAYEWQMNDRHISSQGALDLFDKAFTVLVAGDFNGDGKSDLIFENPTTGGVWQWQLNGTTITSQGAVDVGDKTYHLLGTADFNGDGKDDLLWRNDAGVIYEWQMNGKVDTPKLVQPLSPAWHIVGAADFDGDGKADILLRNISATSDNGAFFLWEMNGNLIKAQGGIERPGTDWQILGVGDFDGDGRADFAVRHVSNFAAGEAHGAVWVYLMNGTTIKAQGAAGVADATTWHVQEIGDLNGDGKADILFRNDTGYFYSWDMNGTSIASEGLAGTEAGNFADPAFHVVTHHWDVV